MQIREYKNIFEKEASHFFYTANHKIVLSLVKKYLPAPYSNVTGPTERKTRLKILDAGCGTGLLAKKLSRIGRVVGVDVSPEAIKYARKRAVAVKQGSVTKLPFKNNSFYVVTCIDVIYHKAVADDKTALKELYRVLSPGGILVLRVPANKWLKLAHDKHVHTRQRYNFEELRRKLLKTGFKIEKLSYVNSLLLPMAAIRHFWEKIKKPRQTESAISELPKPLNTILNSILSTEARLLPHVNLPFGLGLIAVARKVTPQSTPE